VQVRNLLDSSGNMTEEAGPSMAVQVVGLNSVPVAGDEFNVLQTEQEVTPPFKPPIHFVDASYPMLHRNSCSKCVRWLRVARCFYANIVSDRALVGGS
jgi:hypothetical protein